MVKRVVRSMFCVWLIAFVLLAVTGSCLAQQSESARKLFRQTKAKAAKGDAASQLALGNMYASGEGVEQDFGKSTQAYRKAAEQGLAAAQFQLALNYLQGLGMKKKDPFEGAFWLRKAADQNVPEAQVELGRCYLAGKGVSSSGVDALQWFRKAAEQGFVPGAFYIGQCYFDGTGVPRDIEAGFDWTRRAAEAGSPSGQNALGNCYEKGKGVERDYVQAYKWYSLAAARDDENAADIRVSMAKVEAFLTKEQVSEAQRLAREFKPVPLASTVPQPGTGTSPDAAYGVVSVSAAEGSAEVLSDGEFVGNTPARLKLKEGTHVIEVKRSGFKPYRRELMVTAGSELTLQAILEKE